MNPIDLQTVTLFAPRYTEADRKGDAWRGTRREIAEHIFWVRQYRRYLEKGNLSESYRKHITRALAMHVRDYLENLRRAVELEAWMDANGVAYTKDR